LSGWYHQRFRYRVTVAPTTASVSVGVHSNSPLPWLLQMPPIKPLPGLPAIRLWLRSVLPAWLQAWLQVLLPLRFVLRWGFHGYISHYGFCVNVPVTGVKCPNYGICLCGRYPATHRYRGPCKCYQQGRHLDYQQCGCGFVSSAGLVTGVAAGKATITVRTTDGGFTATSTITVSAVNVPVTGLQWPQLRHLSMWALPSNSPLRYWPSNATNKAVTWTTSSASVARLAPQAWLPV